MHFSRMSLELCAVLSSESTVVFMGELQAEFDLPVSPNLTYFGTLPFEILPSIIKCVLRGLQKETSQDKSENAKSESEFLQCPRFSLGMVRFMMRYPHFFRYPFKLLARQSNQE